MRNSPRPIEPSETLNIRGLNDEFTDMRFHGKPAEGQTSVVGVFLELPEYHIGLRVVFRAASNQVNLSAVRNRLNAELAFTVIELPVVGQGKRVLSHLIRILRGPGDSCLCCLVIGSP